VSWGRVPGWLRPAPGSVAEQALWRGRSPWVDAVHVLWSAWVFITPVFLPGGYNLRWGALTALSYPVFLLLYAMSLLAAPRRALQCALGMVALALALMPWYPSALSYFVFGCVMLRMQSRDTLPVYLFRLLLLNGVFAGWGAWLGYPWQALAWMPLVTGTVGTIVHFEQRNNVQDHALKLSHDEVRRLAATAERERIGRDLHDLLGHTLSLVALKADLAGRLLRQEGDVAARASAQREVGEVSRIAREALVQVRSAVSGIRAAGLAGELASARLLLECDGVQLACDGDAAGLDGAPLPADVESALALTVREAVTNIQRHARARSATVAVATKGDEVVLTVADDGRGGAIVPGNGLDGMRERLEALGGSLRFDARPGRGTRIEARLPLTARPHVRDDSRDSGRSHTGLPG
jgi:two-component system, NarL family, sensor histidine kinase DesK